MRCVSRTSRNAGKASSGRRRHFLRTAAATAAFDDVPAARSAYVNKLGLFELFHEIGEAACPVGAFAESRIQLQHSAFQKPKLRLNGAAFQYLQRALDQRHGLREFERRRARSAVLLVFVAVAAISTVATVSALGPVAPVRHGLSHNAVAILEQRFVAHELMAVLLQNRAGERLSADHEHGLAVFLELVHQRDEIAIAADNRKRVDVRVRKSHFQGSRAPG